MAVLLGVVRPRLKVPFPLMNDVTLTDVHVPVLTAPEEPIKVPTGGALV
jgi:hypothetical protein